MAISLLVPTTYHHLLGVPDISFTNNAVSVQAQKGFFTDYRMPAQNPPVDPRTLWFCGHCSHGPMSKRFVSACVNCFRPKDHLAYSQRLPKDKGFEVRGSATGSDGIFVYNDNVVKNDKNNNSSQITQKRSRSRSKARIESRENATGDNSIGTDERTDLSDVASVESLSSIPGLTSGSTLSTVSSQEALGAAEELAILLLQDEDLKPLYEKALERMEINKFKRNLTKLLGTFAIDLLREAGNGMQRSAAQFVKERTEYVTSCIGNYYALGRDETSEHMDALKMQASQREGVIEGYLEQQILYNNRAIDFSAAPEIKEVGQSEKEPESDESLPDLGDRSQLRNLDGVKNFILDSSAIMNLRENLRRFVFGEHDGRQVKEASACPPFEASMVEHSNEFARLENSDLDESMHSHEATVIQLEPLPGQAAFATKSLLCSILTIIESFVVFLELREEPLRPGYGRIRWTCVRLLCSSDQYCTEYAMNPYLI